MRKLFYLNFVAVIVISLIAPTLACGVRDTSAETVKAEEPLQNIELPMLFRGPMPAVEVTVNGKGPFIFAIDTGASGMARADSSLVEKLSLPDAGEVRAGDGSGATVAMKIVRMASLTFGGLEFKDVEALSRNYNVSPRMPHIDGILGFNLFKDHLLTLDYAKKVVRIEKGQLPAVNGKDVLSFDSSRGAPAIELQVGSEKVTAHIDTGNAIGPFVVPTSLAEKFTFSSTPRIVGRARSGASEIEIKEAQLKGTIKLGAFDFADPMVTFPAINQYVNIGSRALVDFTLTFDQKNQRVKLGRREALKAQPATAADLDLFKEYAGQYGQRTISLEDGALFIQRTDGPKIKLVPLPGGEYSLPDFPAARIKFVKKDGSWELKVLNPQGAWETSKKEVIATTK